MIYTNNHNIPLALAVFLATNDYDKHNSISATTLLKPIKQIILSQRVQDNLIDISSLVSARMGSAIHSAIENAWKEPKQALQALGYSDSIIDRIVINPSLNELTESSIPIYIEQRVYKDLNGFKVSGKYDFVAEGKVQDFKSTSVYNYLNQSNVEKYQLQGSIYRWLAPDIITKDVMNIHYIFTDWSKVESIKNKDYPNNRVLTQSIPLLSLSETENYISNKLNQIRLYSQANEEDIPECSDIDLWRKPTVYKYYKNPNSSRSTKNYDNSSDAYNHFVKDGSIGLVKEVKGQVTACKYCPAFSICKQKDRYINDGSLII